MNYPSSFLLLVQAVEKYKASVAAAKNGANNAKSESAKDLPKPKPESSRDLNAKTEPSVALPKQRSSTLPPGFFDDHDTKRQKIGNYYLLWNFDDFSFSARPLVK